MNVLYFVLYLLLGLAAIVILFIKRRFAYWKNAGVPYTEPTLPMGNLKGVGSTRHFIDAIDDIYRKFKKESSFCGTFFSIKPVAMITDLELIKTILIKDFANFQDRTMYCNEEADLLTGNLFFLHGERWRTLRNKLSPTFTSGKMKLMFPTVLDVSQILVDHISDMLRIESDIEIKDILARYTTDIIGRCALGIECNSLKDPNADFRKFGAKSVNEPRHSKTVIEFLSQFPQFGKFFGMKIFGDDVIEFFYNTTKQTVEYREKNNIHRNDFIDLLIEMKNDKRPDAPTLTLKEIVAQVFVFFMAGFETSSSNMTFSLYELAMNEDLQEKARKSVHEVLAKHNDQMTYEAIADMTYVGQVLTETLRKYPVLMTLIRKANQNYMVPNTNKIIEKDISVIIPVYSIQHDPDIYPNPEIFDPDRFSSEEMSKRHPMSFLGFGDGPRNCIGSRFGIMQSRTGLATLLKNFRFKMSPKTTVPMKFDPKCFVLSAYGGLNLIVEKI